MFRRYPYWGWLVLSLALWCINEVHFHSHRQELLPERMTAVVQEDLKTRLDAADRFLERNTLLEKIIHDSLTEAQSDELGKLRFFFYIYDRDSLRQ